MGRSSNSKMLLLIAIFVLGIYILPSAVAKYAGSHTWELNTTGGSSGLQCGRCHSYIKNEINAAGTTDVAYAHLNASNYSGYVGPGMLINITYTPDGTLDDVCWMCHVLENDATVTGGHTKVVIRVCTDTDCHGDQVGTGGGSIWDTDKMNVTGLINSSEDAHMNFYRPLNQFDSAITNEDTGVAYKAGFIACLACHTHVGLDLNVTRPQKLSLSLEVLTDASWNATGLTVNYTNMTSSLGGKEPGSVWF